VDFKYVIKLRPNRYETVILLLDRGSRRCDAGVTDQRSASLRRPVLALGDSIGGGRGCPTDSRTG
jgi:hypothetical protein